MPEHSTGRPTADDATLLRILAVIRENPHATAWEAYDAAYNATPSREMS